MAHAPKPRHVDFMHMQSTRAIGALHPRIGGTGRPASALSAAADTRLAAADIVAQLEAQLLGAAPTAVLLFASPVHDDALLAGTIAERYPSAQVIGCTTAGEFAEREGSVGGVAAIALPATTARAAYATLARFDRGTDAGIREAMARLGNTIGEEPSMLDPKRWVGVVLLGGLHGREQAANDALALAAPQLAFVGGSAGDDLQFRETRVFHDGTHAADGAVLMLLDMVVPFTIVTTSSIALAGGRPPQALPAGGLQLRCRAAGGESAQMHGAALVDHTRAAIARAAHEVGGRAGGIIAFNCILRRLAIDGAGAHAGFRDAFGGVPTAGFHGYGESWRGHMNQTCTALVFA